MIDGREKLIKTKNANCGRRIKNLWEIIMYWKYLYISLLRTFRNTIQGSCIKSLDMIFFLIFLLNPPRNLESNSHNTFNSQILQQNLWKKTKTKIKTEGCLKRKNVTNMTPNILLAIQANPMFYKIVI